MTVAPVAAAELPVWAAIVIAVISALGGSYLGPRMLAGYHARKEAEKEARRDQPAEHELAEMLQDPRYPIRSLERLSRRIGTKDNETRRLLRQIGAHGVTMEDGSEGWTLGD